MVGRRLLGGCLAGALLVGLGVTAGALSSNGRTIVGGAGRVRLSEHRTARQNGELGGPVSGGCAPLGLRLRAAAAHGQSLVTGYGRLTGARRTVDGTDYLGFRLTGLHTVAGPSVPATLTARLATSPSRAAAAADTPGLWAPDGHLLAMITPGDSSDGPIASVAPLIGDRVILSAAGCWSDPSLAGSRFTQPLAEVPGSDTYRLAEQAGGFVSCPLFDVARLAGG